jgi:hypothetical protein
MATTTELFDSVGDAVNPADDQSVAALGPLGTSFSTGASAEHLSSVTLGLFDTTPGDGGTLTIELLSNSSGNTPGSVLEMLGTVADSKLGTSDTSTYTLSNLNSPTLSADTRYWIEVIASSGSKAVLAYSDADSGTGVSSEYTYFSGNSEPNPSAGANIANIVATAPCYCPGSLLLTERGDVAVENLTIGDRLVTGAGEAKPIRWIGQRTYQGRFVAGNRRLLPVCVKAGAMGSGLPRRDLWVSPLHAMVVDGCLVPAGGLVNGVSVVQAAEVDEVRYIHIELDQHSVIYAEGAASESFVDDDSRSMFHNAHTFVELYPDARPVPAVYCLPRVEDGEELERLRAIVDAHAGLSRAPAVLPRLVGYLDRAQDGLVEGWAQAVGYPEAPVCLDVIVDGVLAATVLANRHRVDLEQAGLGSGRHAFSVTLDLAPDAEVEVRRSLDGAVLPCPLLRRSAA